MASLTRWTWVWVNPGSWWWTGRPGVLLFMGSQRVAQDWATELNWLRLGMIQLAILEVQIEINLDAYKKLHFCRAQNLNLLHIRWMGRGFLKMCSCYWWEHQVALSEQLMGGWRRKARTCQWESVPLALCPDFWNTKVHIKCSAMTWHRECMQYVLSNDIGL